MNFLIGLGILLLLALALFVPFILPYALSFGVSALIAFKITHRWLVRAVLLITLPALISLNGRIPALIDGDPNDVRITVGRPTIIGPREKALLDTDSEYIYFRRDSDPPDFGFRNDWSIGFRPLRTVYEKPAQILSELGIAHTTGESGRVVLRIRTSERLGVMTVSANVLVDGNAVSTYSHKVRKAYPLEEFDYYGSFRKGDWRPTFLYLTQRTFWVPRGERIPANYRPLRDFIERALAQGGVSEQDTAVAPKSDPLNVPEKLRRVTAKIDLEHVLLNTDLPAPARACEGEDAGQPFTAIASGTIFWKDKEIPPMTIPGSPVGGYYAFVGTIFCDRERNRFWLGAYHLGQLNLWRYRVDFRARSLRLEHWAQADVPPQAKKLFDPLPHKHLRIGAIRQRSAEVFLVYVVQTGSRSPKAEMGYRIEMRLQ